MTIYEYNTSITLFLVKVKELLSKSIRKIRHFLSFSFQNVNRWVNFKQQSSSNIKAASNMLIFDDRTPQIALNNVFHKFQDCGCTSHLLILDDLRSRFIKQLPILFPSSVGGNLGMVGKCQGNQAFIFSLLRWVLLNKTMCYYPCSGTMFKVQCQR